MQTTAILLALVAYALPIIADFKVYKKAFIALPGLMVIINLISISIMAIMVYLEWYTFVIVMSLTSAIYSYIKNNF